jgi:hypothetical protein
MASFYTGIEKALQGLIPRFAFWAMTKQRFPFLKRKMGIVLTMAGCGYLDEN